MFENLPNGVQNGTPLGKLDSRQQFRAQVHYPKTMAELFPNGFIWTPVCPDLDQALFVFEITAPNGLSGVSFGSF